MIKNIFFAQLVAITTFEFYQNESCYIGRQKCSPMEIIYLNYTLIASYFAGIQTETYCVAHIIITTVIIT